MKVKDWSNFVTSFMDGPLLHLFKGHSLKGSTLQRGRESNRQNADATVKCACKRPYFADTGEGMVNENR